MVEPTSPLPNTAKSLEKPSGLLKRIPREWWLFAGLLLPVCPWCFVYLQQSWRNPAFQYIPLLLIFAGWLLGSRYRPGTPGRASLIAGVIACIGVVVAGLGAVSNSPWLVWVGMIGIAALIAAHFRHREDDSHAWPVWLLLWVSVRPPGSLADQFVTWLQYRSTTMASRLLDMLHVMHYQAGNVIEVPSKRFLVEEACSGVQSLFTLVFIASALAVLYRRSLIQAACLVIAAAVSAMGMNATRILIVILQYIWYQRDWTTGWKHELVGYFALGMAGLLLLSTDRLLYFFFGPITEAEEEVQQGRLLNPLALVYNRWIAGSVSPLGVRPLPIFAKRISGPLAIPRRGLLIALCMTAMVIGCLGVPTLWGYYGTGTKASTKGVLALENDSMPESFESWKRVGYEVEERGRDSRFGQYSSVWQYKLQEMPARVSLDYHFEGWHELVMCYQGIGWEIVERKNIANAETPGDWDGVEVVLRNSSGMYGLLYYSLFTESGEKMEPNVKMLMGRLRLLGNPPVTYQAQVFVPLATPPDESTKQAAEALHRLSREKLLDLALPLRVQP